MYFRGSGKATVLKREAARGTMMAALWHGTYICFPNGYIPEKRFLELPVFLTHFARHKPDN